MARQTSAPIRSSAAEVLTYIASTGDPQDSIEMRYEDENIWLTQKTMARLYDVSVPTINEHIKKIFSDSELQEDSVIRKFRITASDGKNYNTNHYALQMIIAVGFKVNPSARRCSSSAIWVNPICGGTAAAPLGIDLEPDGDDHLQRVVIGIVVFSVGSSDSEFPNH